MYGADIACLALGGVYLAITLLIWTVLSCTKRTSKESQSQSSDPLAKYIPDSVANDPSVIKLMQTVNDHPVAATSAAASVGLMIGREHFSSARGK